jgi:magnesium transporter
MLNIFIPQAQGLARVPPGSPPSIADAAVWIDLLEPTPEEEKLVESTLGIDVPTREEMKEIETSNRLYEDNGALYMTSTVAAQLDTDRPVSMAVTFILAGQRLVTNRYLDTKPFQQFITYAEKHPAACSSPLMILAGLMEAFTERIADVLERVGSDLDNLSGSIFAHRGNGTPDSRDLRQMIERIGFNGELNSKSRESLVSLGRLLMFVQQSALSGMTSEQRDRFHSISRDVTSLSDHASFLGTKSSFLLEATLGLINIEQNNIIKIFSIVAVMLMPPTLVASIYGMNFHFMPELKWPLGYPLAIVLMLVSGFIPYVFFKRRGWL